MALFEALTLNGSDPSNWKNSKNDIEQVKSFQINLFINGLILVF